MAFNTPAALADALLGASDSTSDAIAQLQQAIERLYADDDSETLATALEALDQAVEAFSAVDQDQE